MNIPATIIEDEILWRLPAKTLSRFKCVCKRWRSLIESRSFIDRHLRHDHGPDHDRLVLCNYTYVEVTRFGQLVEPSFPCKSSLTLMGSEVGILCQVTINGDITLFNPSTRKFKQVPPLPLFDSPRCPPHHCEYGFGFNPLTGEYKIVMFHPHRKLVRVYNSASDSWKFMDSRLDSIELGRVKHSTSKAFMNGVHYWLLLSRLDYNMRYVALALDMRSERFREIQLPNGSLVGRRLQIGARGDSLTLLEYESELVLVHLWLMGEQGFWIRSFTVGPFQNPMTPYCVWKNEMVLRESVSDNLILIDVSTRKQRKVAIPPIEHIPHDFEHYALFYKESLVSIKGEHGYGFRRCHVERFFATFRTWFSLSRTIVH